MDKTTRLYDRKVLEVLDVYIEHQYSEVKAGKPRNIEKFRQGADDLIKRAEALLDLEIAIKKKQVIELPQWHKDLYKPKGDNVRQLNSGKAPTPSQIEAMIKKEVEKALKVMAG